MRKTVFLLLFFPMSLAAQTALSIAPRHCVWKEGDDPRRAAPSLDDSDWKPVSEWGEYATPRPFFWLRCSFEPGQLAPAIKPVLQVSGDLAWQVFADGQMIAESGNMTTGEHTAGLAIDYPAPEFTERSQPVLVAVRITFSPEMNGVQPLPALSLGDAELQRNAYWSQVYERTQSQWLTWACYALIASAGLFFFALYWFDRTQRFLLWISLTWLSLADLRINEFLVAASVHYPSRLEYFLYAIGQILPVFIILFFFALNRRRVPVFYWIVLGINFYFWAALVVAAFLPLRQSMILRWDTEVGFWMNTLQVVATLVAITCVPVAFWPLRALRGWQIPLAAVCHLWVAMDFTYMIVQLPFLHLDITDLFLKIQPYRSLAIAIVVVTMTLLLVQRLRSTNRDRAALQGEMDAARQIQRLLVPAALDSASSWSIDAAYLPAREVGGDFYRCRVLPGGAHRVLLGDVSGKGAAAAMTAAMLLGASEGHEESTPGEILSHLNRVLNSSQVGGLATCFCVDLAPDGRATLANAGHLAPYWNGEELKLASGLPLGVTAHEDYDETEIHLAPGDLLTLLSDGVVEARSATGELFGFERTRALSTEPAQEIARAAQHFGQNDDITVLTLSLAAAEVAHA
ncbi:MAG: PP2C family protein-serine/threonine phosphatase [Terracidiphilus sp.]